MKAKISILFISLMIVSAVGKLYPQDIMYPTAFPSPSSMGLVASVNHTTGNINVSVPLINFESNGIVVPIGISYNTSGIRVEDRPTEMGYGWRLVAGGKITRVVKRRPDDLSRGTQLWLRDSLFVAVQYFQNIGSKWKNYNELQDGEPDLFYYEIPGKSGCLFWMVIIPPHNSASKRCNDQYREWKPFYD